MVTESTRAHAGVVAALAMTDRQLWSRLVGCRVWHRQFGLGTLLKAQNGLKYVYFKFDRDRKSCKFNVRDLENGNTQLELPKDLFEELAPKLTNPALVLKEAQEVARRLEKHARRSRLKEVETASPGSRAASEGRKKGKPQSKDLMNRGRRLSGSFENGKRK